MSNIPLHTMEELPRLPSSKIWRGRMRVEGGWVYETLVETNAGISLAMAFVPDALPSAKPSWNNHD